MTISSRWIEISTNGGDSFEGYLALPKAGKGPGVVIIQEIFGVNSHIRAVADQYAADGYVALAPTKPWNCSGSSTWLWRSPT
jgi:carboxymethylenebutenolidase